jgi:hypothetical protein
METPFCHKKFGDPVEIRASLSFLLLAYDFLLLASLFLFLASFFRRQSSRGPDFFFLVGVGF